MRKSYGFLLVAVAGLAWVAGAAQAGADEGACAVVESPFTLEEIVDAAVDEVPGEPLKAGFTVQPTGELDVETLFKVKIAREEGGRALLFFDTETGERVEPVEPALSLLEAYDLAVAAVEAEAGNEGAVVLRGKLRRRVLVAHYDFGIADPDARLALARVDALTGEVDLIDPRRLAKLEKKRELSRRYRKFRIVAGKRFPCDGFADEDQEEEEELLNG